MQELKQRLLFRLQNYLSIVLGIGIIVLLAWLSTRYSVSFDWTSHGRHTLSATSQQLLKQLPEPIDITAYAHPEPGSRQLIQNLINRYQRAKSNIRLRFVDPDTVPDELRQLGIRTEGELIVHYRDRSQHVQELSEQALTNTLQRLLRADEQWLVFLEGHGERDPFGKANRDLGQWGDELIKRGLKVQSLHLGKTPTIPDNTVVLVIADPQVALLPGEIQMIDEYLDRGGNLLWLIDPGVSSAIAEMLTKKLGITLGTGTIVDPTTAMYGVNQPTIALGMNYSQPILQQFTTVTVFPFARHLTAEKHESGWDNEVLVATNDQAWAEQNDPKTTLVFDANEDIKGPLSIGLGLSRELVAANSRKADGKKQRVVVIGDGDFLSNSYLGNAGNLDLGIKTVNWLMNADSLIAIAAHTGKEREFNLPDTTALLLWLWFMLALPAMLCACGIVIWRKRRRS
jgi:ABC-type uncharacterized transport system involved in gliding motility auxiliary subunit